MCGRHPDVRFIFCVLGIFQIFFEQLYVFGPSWCWNRTVGIFWLSCGENDSVSDGTRLHAGGYGQLQDFVRTNGSLLDTTLYMDSPFCANWMAFRFWQRTPPPQPCIFRVFDSQAWVQVWWLNPRIQSIPEEIHFNQLNTQHTVVKRKRDDQFSEDISSFAADTWWLHSEA